MTKPYHNNPKPKTVKIFGRTHTYVKFPKNTSIEEGLNVLTETVQKLTTEQTN